LGLADQSLASLQEPVHLGIEAAVDGSLDIFDRLEGDHLLSPRICGFELLEGYFVVQLEEILDNRGGLELWDL
jgi:hypothetical protein